MEKYKFLDSMGLFIIALLGEEESSVLKTIKFAKSLNCNYASFSFATPDTGTNLRDEAIINNWILSDSKEVRDSSSLSALETNELSKENLKKLWSHAY